MKTTDRTRTTDELPAVTVDPERAPADFPALSGADLSSCGTYRYRLWRAWGPGERLLWVMLNPSTADASVDDATIRRCVSFSRREGYGGLTVVNLFAARATDPRDVLDIEDPVGPENDVHVQAALFCASVAIAAWGAWPPARLRAHVVAEMAPRGLWCLGTTFDGSPRHPLYVRAATPLARWRDVLGGDEE